MFTVGISSQEVCGGLTQNNPPSLIYSTWSPDGGTAWERLGGVALLMCDWGWPLRLQKPMQARFLSLPAACGSACKALSYCLLPPVMIMD